MPYLKLLCELRVDELSLLMSGGISYVAESRFLLLTVHPAEKGDQDVMIVRVANQSGCRMHSFW